MFCQFCGNSLDDNARFCNRCGAPVNASAPTANVPTAAPAVPNGNPAPVTGAEVPSSTPANGFAAGAPEGGMPAAPNAPYNGAPVAPNMPYNGMPVDPNAPYQATPYPVAPAMENAQADKKGKVVAGICWAGAILGVIGVLLTIFLLTSPGMRGTLGLVAHILMAVGFLSVVVRVILNFAAKIGKFPTHIVKRILIIVIAVACVALSIVGIAERITKNYTYYSGGSSYSGSSVSFVTIYSECNCKSPWASYGSTYLEIDTNPYDYDGDSSAAKTYLTAATTAIRSIHSKLSVPSYVYDDMLETRAMDGTQHYYGTKVNISWTYHPDQGLEVRYTLAS